jgi:hypothetical protein
MAEALTALTRLQVIREIQEDAAGATLHFQRGGSGRLGLREPSYAAALRLARRSLERQHPVGVCLGDGQAVTELVRADNDVPTELRDEQPDRTLVLFQGHDGVFHLKRDHPDSARLRLLLREATRQKARVWFIAQKPDLTLLDVLAPGAPGGDNEPFAGGNGS